MGSKEIKIGDLSISTLVLKDEQFKKFKSSYTKIS